MAIFAATLHCQSCLFSGLDASACARTRTPLEMVAGTLRSASLTDILF